MEPSHTAPRGYALARSLDFSRESTIYLWINIVMAVMLLVFYVFFSNLTVNIRTDFEGGTLGGFSGWGVLIVFLMAFVMMFLHEGIHWLMMWAMSGVKPNFTARGLNPHAFLPGVYFSPSRFLSIKLAPVILLSAVFFVAAPIFPLAWIQYLLFFFAGNVAYAAADLLAVTQVLRTPGKKLMEDLSERVNIYTPIAKTSDITGNGD